MLYSITLNRNCNFSCNYCYQSQKRSSVMSEEVMEKTINFIEQHINANGIKNTVSAFLAENVFYISIKFYIY